MPRDTSTELQILGAAYGLAKVTSKIISLVNRQSTPQSLTVQASDAVFGNSWPGHPKCLTVVYRYGDTGAPQVATATEGNTLTIGQSQFEAAPVADEVMSSPSLTIYGASYGPMDVSSQVRGMVSPVTQTLSLTPNNATFGDSWPFRAKTFVIVASYENQVPFVDIVTEGSPYSLKFRPRLQILSAFWGLIDVRSIVQSNISRRALSVIASDATFGDGWPGVTSQTLDVVYQYGNSVPQLAIVTEGNTLTIDFDASIPIYTPPADPRTLNVIRAVYGPMDVTSQVSALITNQTLNFTANNATFGDPWPFHPKSFTLTYSWGPSAVSSLVVRELQPVSVSEPTVEWNRSFISMVGFFADGDHLKIQTGVGQYWAVGSGGQITATAVSVSDAEQFTIGVAGAGVAEITLKASDGSYVVVGNDGTLHTGGTAQQAALIIPSVLTSGSVVLCLSGGGGAPFMQVNAASAIVANGSYTTDFSSSFNLLLTPTAVGSRNHLMAYTGLSEADLAADLTFDPLLLKVGWDLTGGFFLAIGLGPLLAGGDRPAAGVFSLLRANARTSAMLDRIISAVRNNPEASLTALFIAMEGVIWDESLMWPIFRLAASFGGGFLAAFAIAKILEFTILPEVWAAELATSFGIWAYTTTSDVLAYINAGGNHSFMEAVSVAEA